MLQLLNKKKFILKVFLFFVLSFEGFLQALSQVSDTLAEKATNPLSGLTQLQLENDYTPLNFGTTKLQNQFYVKPVGWIERGSFFLSQFVRLKFLVQSFPKSKWTTTAIGLSDTQFLDLLTLQDNSFGDFGFGIIAIFPTASKKELGQGKWQLGPAIGLVVKNIKRWQIGFLAQNPISIAGQSKQPFQNTLLFQPLLTRHFTKGWYLNSNPTWTLNFSQKTIQVPVNFGVGRVFKLDGTKLDLNIQAEWMVLRSGPGLIPKFTLQFCLNVIFD